MNVAVLRKKWFLSDAALADIFLNTYAPPDPRQCWHLRKRTSAGKTRIFSKIGMKKIDKMQENENRVQTETRRFCLVSVREKHFRYVFGKTPDGAPRRTHRNEDEIPRTPNNVAVEIAHFPSKKRLVAPTASRESTPPACAKPPTLFGVRGRIVGGCGSTTLIFMLKNHCVGKTVRFSEFFKKFSKIH